MELLQLLVRVAKGFKLGMATYGTLMGDAMGLPSHLWVWPWIYGADTQIYGAGRHRSSCCSCWWGWRRDLSWEWPRMGH